MFLQKYIGAFFSYMAVTSLWNNIIMFISQDYAKSNVKSMLSTTACSTGESFSW
jgi:hypothetical protein